MSYVGHGIRFVLPPITEDTDFIVEGAKREGLTPHEYFELLADPVKYGEYLAGKMMEVLEPVFKAILRGEEPPKVEQ